MAVTTRTHSNKLCSSLKQVMLKMNQPNGFRARMGSSVRRTWALIWVLPLLQTKHSFVLPLLLTKPHCQPVLLGSLCRVCKATPHSSVPAQGERTPLLTRSGAVPVRCRRSVARPSLEPAEPPGGTYLPPPGAGPALFWPQLPGASYRSLRKWEL